MDGAICVSAYKRAANIVRIEEKRDGQEYRGPPDTSLLTDGEEKSLARALDAVEEGLKTALEREDFVGAMAALAMLRQPVDKFFDRVTVNTDDEKLRVNRLRLLSRIVGAMNLVADFSRIEG